MPAPSIVDPRRLVGVHAERIGNVSSTDFPGHYPDEDNSWDLIKFQKVRFFINNTRGVEKADNFAWKGRT